MKALLKLIYLVSIVIIIFLFTGLFLPKTYELTDSIAIPVNASLIYDQLNTIANWEQWAPWFKEDNNIQVKYTDSISGTGAGYSWKSLHYGAGNMLITDNAPLQKVQGEIQFNQQARCLFSFILKERDNQVEVQCQVKFIELGYFERYYFYFLDDTQKQLTLTLENLKAISKELRLSRVSPPIIQDYSEIILMTRMDTVANTELNQRIAYNFKRLSTYMKRRKLNIIGDSMVIYYNDTSETLTHFACAYPIRKKSWSWKNYQCFSIQNQQVASIKHWGDYESKKPYSELQRILAEQDMKPDSFYWETYQVIPTNEPDTSLWEKTVYYPVRKQ